MTTKPIYLYQCPNNHVDYGWEDKGDQPQCPECAAFMRRSDCLSNSALQVDNQTLSREVRRLMDFEVAVLKLVEQCPSVVPGDFPACILKALGVLGTSRRADS